MNEASLRDRPIIQIRNLSKVYFMGEERVIALKNINLSINRGEICCIFGTSGSGKSTLLNQAGGSGKTDARRSVHRGKKHFAYDGKPACRLPAETFGICIPIV